MTEPFPDIDPSHAPELNSHAFSSTGSRRRKSSNLRGDPRGDTAGPALATLYDQSPSPNGSISLPSKTGHDRSARRSKRKRVKSFFRRWKSFSFKHTWFSPLIACIAISSVYLVNPSPSNPVYPALFLSYALPPDPNADPAEAIQYGKGKKDLAFVAFYTIFLSFTREFIMQRFLRPWAIRHGIRSRAKQSRFMEQAYTAVYFIVFGPLGLYVMSKTDLWYFNTSAMYEGFPHKTHSALFKGYYLFQASYWAQQMIVLLLMLEKPRKDFKELVAHHIITLSLIGLSYRYHFTRMGLPVYITHDISDFFLATSKILNYLDSSFVIPYFVIFIGAWTYLRHYQNLRFIASMLPLPSPFPDWVNIHLSHAYDKFAASLSPLISLVAKISPAAGALLNHAINGQWAPAQFATVGPYDVNWTTQQYKCWISQWITFLLLAALQAVNLFWLFLIFRILYRVLRSFGAEVADERSEYDTEEEEERAAELDKEKAKESNGNAEKH